ncbi:MAG: hypothetical protein MJ240_14515 [Kiritimatiellae bacterium]|nr:hypothetical protein [Kiritimatiellia bacterium]
MKNICLLGFLGLVGGVSLAAAVPTFDAQLVANSPDCKYIDYCKRTPQTFSMVDGRSVVTFNYVKRNEPKGYDSEWGILTRAFAVTAGKEGVVQFVLGGQIKRTLGPGGHLTWLGADGKPILYQDALGKMSPIAVALKQPYVAPNSKVSSSWTRLRVPDGACQAKIEFKADNPDLKEGQTASIHRLAYYEYDPGEPNDLDDLEAPTLELLTPSPNADFTAPLKFRLVDKSGVDERSAALKIDGRDVPLAALSREGDAYVYTNAVPWEEGSLHEIHVTLADKRGNYGSDCVFVAFTAKKAQHPKWSVREDGMPLKDGEAFYPFGWCRIRPCVGNGFDMDRGVREMQENGLNVGHTYMSRRDGPQVGELLDDLLNVCERRDLLLYYEPSYRNPDRPEFLPLAQKSLFAGRARKLSFWWGIGDDTSMQVMPQQIRRYYRVCKAVDPDVLTVSADVVGGAGLYEPFLPYLDVLAVETYPLREETPQDYDMAKSAANIDGAWRDIKSSGISRRAVVALPQNFKGWRGWKRLPTMAEIKAQTYITTACRARGIIFYASTGQKFHLRQAETNIAMSATCPLDEPQFKAEFFAFTREFSKLLPSLAKADAAQQPTVTIVKGPAKNVLGGDAVRCLLKEDGLLIAANTSHLEVTAEITCPDGRKITHVFPRYGYLVNP